MHNYSQDYATIESYKVYKKHCFVLDHDFCELLLPHSGADTPVATAVVLILALIALMATLF